MKQILFMCMVVLYTANTVQAQTTEGSNTIKPANLFKKKDRQAKGNSNMPYVESIRGDERTQYLVKNLLPSGDTVKLAQFLASGIDPNGIADHTNDISILDKSLRWHSVATVACLLNHGADPNMRVRIKHVDMFSQRESYTFSRYPLEAAADANSIEKMELLLKYGADIKRCVNELNRIAASKGNTEMMMYISQQTGVNAIPANALAVMTTYSYEHDASKVTPEMIRQLLKKGVDINAYSSSGTTTLINVIKNDQIHNKIPLVKELIANGVDVNKPSRMSDHYRGAMKFYPKSPLLVAVETGYIEIVKLLIEAGADVKSGNLIKYAKTNEIKEYLILKGAN